MKVYLKRAEEGHFTNKFWVSRNTNDPYLHKDGVFRSKTCLDSAHDRSPDNFTGYFSSPSEAIKAVQKAFGRESKRIIDKMIFDFEKQNLI